MNFKSDTKKFRMYADNTYKCKCGHSITIPNFINKKLCTWCGNYVYKNKKEEFRDKLKNVMEG